ncbi:restriction endonuclease subunit S [Acinetobacter haemolyticus]|uniref:restriction endonuclease subunit S n=1 Tax=Acinetobacter haemolyticus TaxID=29430 RepID=UPI001331F9B1|nr:restriction endonuclease subunit S [Acinetobacter haemolyticus]NAR87020.1 restriction endonuclease subunit S [Acinetobacter haemolyticus]NAS03045.1 restriction endonuclease subunit S [Acinetobacter haemolyticus]NAS09182.1 restriction endonuclease subunit S [Acinetobacter haemolyticus]QHI32277.1 restriction endonuclease subunit S [Acinetobacter haemolyticus]
MAKYQKYAEYKDSGVEWLGAIPGHWGVTQLKRLGKFITGMTPSTAVEAYYSDEITEYGWIRPEDILEESEKVEPTKFLTKLGWETQRTIPAQSTLICCIGTIGKLGFLGKRAVTNQQITALVPDVRGFSKYYYYLLTASRNQLEHLATGNVVKILNSERLGSLWLPLLSSQNEARQIVHFLDYETAKIDHLIEKQQQLIELLKEKRQAVISHAVTKGLNPNVKMKDSGVEWLGEVPEHWVVKSYRLASRIYRGKFGHRPRNDPAFYDGDYPFIQTGDVARAGKYITSYSQTLNEKGKEVSQLFPKGTLMMAIAANIGDIAILGFEAYAPDSVVGFKPNNDIDLEFLRYSFIAALPALEQTSTQSTQANLNVERIGAVKGTFPSLQEQREIVGYLDNLLEQYRNLVKIAENAIFLMQERRTALISAAVTGKIDVRHWQSPTVAEAQTELSA